ncbi:uncharacterized protein LOC143282557 [Babylonia areolata]|uniref:uncharacterized protein LOC143282557 n=1 Tax=Babylonia areolata TaxID=304850 RepID=UPI003FD272C9
MPKTRLTAKLCSTPTVKSPSSDTSPSTSPSTSVPVLVPSATPTSSSAAAVPKTLLTTAATIVPTSEREPIYATSMPLCASSVDYVVHKDACDSDMESDSDLDDLPDAFSSEVSTSLPVKGDAVWVKYRSHNFWPSLVLHSNPKSKKLHIVFLDDLPINGQNVGERVYLKYNKNKIVPYNHENKSKFEAEGKNLECVEMRKKFQAALNKMVDYLTKRALGLKAACKVFLNEPVSSEDESSTKAEAPPPSQPLPQKPADTHSYPTKRKRKREERDGEKEKDSCTEDFSLKNKSTYRRKAMTPAERRAMRKDKNQPLVDFICSTEMKKHLTKIYREQTPSERHQFYIQGSLRKIQTNSSGPIDDDEQLDMILDHIGDWHQELTQQTLPNMDYLLWVWLPEAIVYALKKVRHCGEKKAKEMFEKGIKLTKSEHREIHNQLIKRW